ncbi:MAG: recombinase family protein [Bdellovibrionales bacterium]|nr:recombinase family protein [Bdellovibrionales bacterium]
MTKLSKAALYARVSTLLNQDPQLQISNLKEFCAARGLEVAGEYVDQGISGAKDRRPALDRMIKDAQRGKIKVIVVAALDRLGRNTLHILKLIQELNHYGVSLISLRENLDFTTPTGVMVLTVLSSIAELERTMISHRIREALAAKRLIAKTTGSSWRSGRPLKVTPQIAREIIAMKERGMSLRHIATQLSVSKTSVLRVVQNGAFGEGFAASNIDSKNTGPAEVDNGTKRNV